jgi:hypothetical protein
MEEGTTVQKVSRRRMLKRIGTGAAVAWLTPIVTSLGSPAEARPEPCVEPNCSWTCGGSLVQCGLDGIAGCLCSTDVDGNCFCWEDYFCRGLAICTVNSDCPPGYACIRSTCCGTNKCLPVCGIGPRSRRHHHGKLASGRYL